MRHRLFFLLSDARNPELDCTFGPCVSNGGDWLKKGGTNNRPHPVHIAYRKVYMLKEGPMAVPVDSIPSMRYAA